MESNHMFMQPMSTTNPLHGVESVSVKRVSRAQSIISRIHYMELKVGFLQTTSMCPGGESITWS
jgi:hypothetical protein